MSGFRLLLVAVLAAIGVGVGIESTQQQTVESKISSIYLGSSVSNVQVYTQGKKLYLSAQSSSDQLQSNKCVQWAVDATSLRQTSRMIKNCDDPNLTGHDVAPYVSGFTPPNGYGELRIAKFDRSTRVTVLGRPLATFEFNSGTYPEWTYERGSLWVYEWSTASGPMVFRVSDTTGQLLQSTPVPSLVRPLLTANENGLYVAAAGSFGNSGDPGTLIYHVGIGARSAHTVVASPEGTDATIVAWLTSEGGDVWADTCTRPLGYACEITRYHGPNLIPVMHASDEGETGNWIVGSTTTGFYSSVRVRPSPGLPSPFEESSKIVHIDPNSGAISIVTTIPLPLYSMGDFAGGVQHASLHDGYLFLATGGPNVLYRIRLSD